MKENTKNVLLGVLIVGLVAMTVAYAALSTTLRISGTASVPAVSWDIHFANWQLVATNSTAGATFQNTAVATPVANLTQSNGTKVEGINVALYQPGDNVRYTFNIVNAGTIDAKLSGITAKLGSTENTTQAAIDDGVIVYDVTCTNDTPLLANNGTASCTLDIKYKEDIVNQNQNQAGSDQTYTQAAKNVNFEASWVYVQK